MAMTERRARILARLAVFGPDAGPDALCRVAVDALEMDGAGIVVLSDRDLRVSVGSTDAVSELIHQLHLDLGEGPAVDAHRGGARVIEPDLAVARARWPTFAPLAVEAGATAIACVPLRIGAVRLGALTCWRRHRGGLTDDQHADLLVLGEVGTRLVLDLQVASVFEGAPAVDQVEFDSVVHQAVGMASVQIGESLETALLRLRAYAFSVGRPVRDVAVDVVARRLRLQQEPNESGPDA